MGNDHSTYKTGNQLAHFLQFSWFSLPISTFLCSLFLHKPINTANRIQSPDRTFSISLLYIYTVLLISMACLLSSGAGLQIENVDVHAAKDLLAKGHRYLDVRTEEEFKKGHVENALNIPYMINKSLGRVKNPKFMNQVLSAIGKEEKLVVGCKSGVRSMHAIKELLNEEFKHACNMEGGYDAWVKKGLPVHYPNKTEL